MHYTRVRRHGEPGPPDQWRERPCQHPKCNRPNVRRGYCAMHAQRFHRYGRLERLERQVSTLRSNEPLKPIDRLTPAELAWAAGFIDGEGSFHGEKHGLRLHAFNTHRKSVEKLQKLFGGPIKVKTQNDETKKHWKTCYVWSVSTLQARDAIKAMLPYFVTKAEQASIALQLIQAFKRSPGPTKNPEIAVERDRLRKALKVANHR